MNDLISVIIPVYNVASYLSMCIESVLSQRYSNLEIILIDDGSNDGSERICDEYAKKDYRIIVIHKINEGAAAAKNVGLKMATGKYLSFVDSDDYLEPNAYEHMTRILQESNADIVQCSYRDVYRDKTVEHLLDNISMNQIDFLVQFTKDWTCALLWDKLYKRTLFDGIYFETGHKIDDEYFTYLGVMNANKIVRNSKVVYNYRKRASSIMYSSASIQQIITDRIDYLSKRRKDVIKRFPQLRIIFDTHYLNMMVLLSQSKNIKKEHIKLLCLCLKDYFHEKNHTRPEFRLLPSLLMLMLFKNKIRNSEYMEQSMNKRGSFFE